MEHRKLWNIVKSDPKILTRDETPAMNILETTKKNKHYEIGLLWETGNLMLPMSRKLAENRLVLIEKSSERNSVLEKWSKEKTNRYISKAYARKLTQNEIRNTSDIANFILHHWVLNLKKPDKVRVVFDAGTKFKGISPVIILLKALIF